MKIAATESAKMPKGTSSVLDARSLQDSYATLLPLLKKGMRVLDIGCGTGAISAGIADAVGETGSVVGIDSSDHLIAKGKADFAALQNLSLEEADLFTYDPAEKFDLIVSARVLQWLNNPEAALEKFKTLLKPGGYISILDYNHTQLEWAPAPPDSMRSFYDAFLKWKSDAGMDNEIADHLPAMFTKLGLKEVQSINANEVYTRGEENFADKAGIWTKVAELRGPQMVKDHYVTEDARLQAISEYNAWIGTTAQSMIMKLSDVQGHI